MLSINMRIFKTVFLLLAFYYNVQCSPLKNDSLLLETLSTKPNDVNYTSTLYDQRQNGSENIHVHLDRTLIFIAPLDDILLVASSIFDSKSVPILNLNKSETHTKVAPAAKAGHRAAIRLANLPLLLTRRFRQD